MKDYLALARLGQAANRRRGLTNAERYRWIVGPLYAEGLSLRAIARTLDERRLRTPEDGSQWTHSMVQRIVRRLNLKRSSQTRRVAA